MRNTNWLRFSSDQTNCWKVVNYDASCIGDSTPTAFTDGNYILKNENGAWYLTGSATSGSGLWVNTDGYYMSSGSMAASPLCTIDRTSDCRSIFTREIRISNSSTSSGSMTVTSIVDWYEKRAQNVTLTTTLTNWKSKF